MKMRHLLLGQLMYLLFVSFRAIFLDTQLYFSLHSAHLTPETNGVGIMQEEVIAPGQTLSVLDAVALIIGIVIGAGIFRTPYGRDF